MVKISEDARERLLADFHEKYESDPQAFSRFKMHIQAMPTEVFEVLKDRAKAFDARLDGLSGADQAKVLRQILAGASFEEAFKSVDGGLQVH